MEEMWVDATYRDLLCCLSLADESMPIENARRCYRQLAREMGADIVTWLEYDKCHEMLGNLPVCACSFVHTCVISSATEYVCARALASGCPRGVL